MKLADGKLLEDFIQNPVNWIRQECIMQNFQYFIGYFPNQIIVQTKPINYLNDFNY